MGLLQRRYSRPEFFIRAHQLYLVLADNLNLSLLTQKRLAALQRAKLPLPKGLPGTGIVITNPTRAGVEQRNLGLLKVSLRYEITNFIHGVLSVRVPRRL